MTETTETIDDRNKKSFLFLVPVIHQSDRRCQACV